MSKRIQWRLEKRVVSELVPYEKNPRIIDEHGLNELKRSFDEIGFAQPININTDNTILSGHARCQQLIKEDPSQEIDVYVPDRKLTPKQEEAVIIRMNKNVAGKWDFESLINDFDFDDLLEWGFTEDELELPEIEKLEGKTDEDSVPEVPKDPVSKRGDIWILGNHRLMCGDSTDAENVKKLIGENAIDVVFTDPPYNQETNGGCKGEIGAALRKQGADIEHLCDFNPSDFLQALPSAFPKNKMNSYIFCNKDLVVDYLQWAKDAGYSYNILFWKKPNAIPIGGSHRPDVEYLLVFRRSAIFNGGIKEVSYSKCLEHSRELSKLHPTLKPIELIENQLQIASNKNGYVMDFFLGSGSTMIACEKVGRRCVGLELSEQYVDVIIKRWQDYTGKEAILESTGETYNSMVKNEEA